MKLMYSNLYNGLLDIGFSCKSEAVYFIQLKPAPQVLWLNIQLSGSEEFDDYSIVYGIGNPDADAFARNFHLNFLPPEARALRRSAGPKDMAAVLRSSFRRLAPDILVWKNWELRSASPVLESVTTFLLPQVSQVASSDVFCQFLRDDREPLPWRVTDGALRVAVILHMLRQQSKIRNFNPGEFSSHEKIIAQSIGGVSSSEFVSECCRVLNKEY